MAESAGIIVNNTFGVDFVMGVGQDISTATDLEFHFTEPNTGTITVKPATLGSGDFIDPDDASVVLFPADTWAEYLIQDGDFTTNGVWSARLKVIGAVPDESFSKTVKFTVEAI